MTDAEMARMSKKELKTILICSSFIRSTSEKTTSALIAKTSLARDWLTTRKIEKELKRVQKKDRKGKELRGCKPPKGL